MAGGEDKTDNRIDASYILEVYYIDSNDNTITKVGHDSKFCFAQWRHFGYISKM